MSGDAPTVARAGDGWHTLEPASKIREGEVLAFRIAGRFLAIGRTPGGFFAVDDDCPHANGSLAEGMIENECLVCPIHGFAYHVRSGEGMDDGEELRVYETRLDGDVLRIRIPEEPA